MIIITAKLSFRVLFLTRCQCLNITAKCILLLPKYYTRYTEPSFPGDPASMVALQVIRSRRKTAASHATSLQCNFELYIDLYIMYNIFYIYVVTLLK